MTDPDDLRALFALRAALQTITPANGYAHDMSESVYLGTALFDDVNHPLPMLSILERPQMPEDMARPMQSVVREDTIQCLVQGFVVDDAENPTVPAYRLMGEVRRCLAQARLGNDGLDILGLGPQCTGLNFARGVARPPDAIISANAFFWVPVDITLVIKD